MRDGRPQGPKIPRYLDPPEPPTPRKRGLNDPEPSKITVSLDHLHNHEGIYYCKPKDINMPHYEVKATSYRDALMKYLVAALEYPNSDMDIGKAVTFEIIFDSSEIMVWYEVDKGDECTQHNYCIFDIKQTLIRIFKEAKC